MTYLSVKTCDNFIQLDAKIWNELVSNIFYFANRGGQDWKTKTSFIVKKSNIFGDVTDYRLWVFHVNV